jgi:hypothetical protein
MLTADASRGAFLSGFTVVVVPLMAGLFGTARLKRSTWGAVAAALVGISLLEDSGAPASWGDFWSFMSAVLFGAQVGGLPGARQGRRGAARQPAAPAGAVLRRARPTPSTLQARVASCWAAACQAWASQASLDCALHHPRLLPQIYRAEYWSKQLSARAAMPMLSVSVLMIAAISLASTAAAHPQATLHLLANPGEAGRLLAAQQLPWAGIIYMGCGVTNGGLVAEIVALQVPALPAAGAWGVPGRGCSALCAPLQQLVRPVVPSGATYAPPPPPLILPPLPLILPPQDVSSTEAAIIYTLEPVFGASLAYVILGERWGASGWVGAALIVASCLCAQLLGVEHEKEGKHEGPGKN